MLFIELESLLWNVLMAMTRFVFFPEGMRSSIQRFPHFPVAPFHIDWQLFGFSIYNIK